MKCPECGKEMRKIDLKSITNADKWQSMLVPITLIGGVLIVI